MAAVWRDENIELSASTIVRMASRYSNIWPDFNENELDAYSGRHSDSRPKKTTWTST